MSREIKFRAWDAEKWRYTNDLRRIGKLFNVDLNGRITLVDFTKEIQTIIVEQYTGLKDKNGLDIYEGDIVKVEDNLLCDYNKFFGENSVVKSTWSKGGAYTIHNWYGDRVLNLDIWLNCVEVIGNIHENPELLGGEE